MRHQGFCLAFAGISVFLLFSGSAQAQVSYSTLDSIHTQDFDSLPNSPENVSLGASPMGWIDNMASPAAGNFSILGWYLYHPVTQSEGGANNHQRLRAGTGSSNTGAFYSFGESATTERALGAKGATTMASASQSMYIGLRLVNDTTETITGFELTYDGEQWRASGSSSAETMAFSYSLSADESNWFEGAGFSNITSLNFTAPVVNPGTAITVNGNSTGRVADITSPVGGLEWLPGEELWLRWGDVGGAAAENDGLAIDNVRFTAGNNIVDPTLITSVMTGASTNPATWSNNQAPSAGNRYFVLSGHTVTVDAPFAGSELRATSGGIVHFDASGIHVPQITVLAGGNITENVTGDFALGDINQPLGTLQLDQDLQFSIDASSNFYLDMTLQGSGDLDFDAASGSTLWLTAAGNHGGTIRFNGEGNEVRLTESQSFNVLEMNSTGANRVFFDPREELGGPTMLIFNQPGTIDHAATSTAPQRRLHGVGTLVANAAVTVDLSKGFPDDSAQAEERRWLMGGGTVEGLQGSADVTVNGTAVNYSNGTNITLNEFEIGSTGQPGTVVVDSYSGTISANNFVNFEIRHHMPNAKYVINQNAVLEMGHQVLISNHQIRFGEIEVNSGGTLDVGFAQQDTAGVSGHHVHTLVLTSEGTRDGDLTLLDGATLKMQINRTATDTVFDKIEADGDVALDGVLNVLVNPMASSGASASTSYGGSWTPTLGETFDIISINSVSPVGDYDGNTSVGSEDYDAWRAAFGSNDAATDGNLDGTVNAADVVLWRDHLGEVGLAGGTITGMFDNVVVTDFEGVMTGFAFKVNYSSSLVQLEVIAPGSGSGTAVPEPTSWALAGAALAAVAIACSAQRQSKRAER